MGTNRPWNWRLPVLKTIKIFCSHHQWPISRWQSELTVRFLHGAPPSACTPWNALLKTPAHWLTERSQLTDMSLPSSWVASLCNNANIPFHQLCLSNTGFWAANSWIPRSVTLVLRKEIIYILIAELMLFTLFEILKGFTIVIFKVKIGKQGRIQTVARS